MKKKGKKGGKMCYTDFTPQNGCGKGKSCDIDLYIQAFGGTQEAAKEYADQGGKLLKEHGKI